MNKQIKQYLSNFFEKHTLLGFMAFLLTLNGFGITFVYFTIEYFFPKETLIIELTYFAFWLNFFLATYLILFSFYQKGKKKVFSVLAFSLVFVPLIFFKFFDYVEIIMFWAESIGIVSMLMLVGTLYTKFKNHSLMKVIYAFLGTSFVYLGFKFEVFQALYHGIIFFVTGILLFFLFLFNLFFGVEPAPSKHFEDFFGQPVPREVRNISFDDQSVIMIRGYSLYILNFEADKIFLENLAIQTKFPEEDYRNKAIHKIECNAYVSSEKTCYKGVIYPYVHNITYDEKSKDLHDSVSYYGELSTW